MCHLFISIWSVGVGSPLTTVKQSLHFFVGIHIDLHFSREYIFKPLRNWELIYQMPDDGTHDKHETLVFGW